MNAFAQFPTPTTATRTLPSSVRRPLALAPFSGCPWCVLMRTKSSSRRVNPLLPEAALRLHLLAAQTRSSALKLTPHVPDALDRR